MSLITSANSYCQKALKKLPSIKYNEPINIDKYNKPKLGDFYLLISGYYYYLRNSKLYRELIFTYPDFMADLKNYLEGTDEMLSKPSDRFKYFQDIVETLI